jgi:glycosyltransferase involved in cell wall biosynthesis
MRVLLVIDSLYTGGAEYSTLLWMEWLLSKGYEVQLILLKEKLPKYDISNFDIETKRVLQLLPGSYISKYSQLNKIVRNFRPSIIHSTLTASNFLCRMLRIANRDFSHFESLISQPYSEARMNDPLLNRNKIVLVRLLDRMSQIKGVDYFHANSEAVSEHYKKQVHIPSEKVFVIPRGRSENDYISKKEYIRKKLNDEFGIPSNHLLLINTGRHVHAKAQDVMLKALPLIDSKIPFSLIIAGREGELTGHIQSLIFDLGLTGKVHLLGHRTDIPVLLAASDIFIFPSRFEGMPGALIEACAAGLPIVCSSLPCMKEVVEEHRNAYLFEPELHIELAAYISDLLNNSELRKSMGIESLKLFKDKFDLESIHYSMLQHYLHSEMNK